MGKEIKKKEENEKVSLWSALKSNCYMLRISFQACPSRVIGSFVYRILQHLNGIYSSIIFWEILLGFVEKGASFSKVIPFLIFTVLDLLHGE